MKISATIALLLLCSFVAGVLAIALLFSPHAVMVVGREDSVGTWMSGALLTFMAAHCLFISMTQRWYPWILFAVFFMFLTLDERFMFHEQIKERIIFAFNLDVSARLIYELPVMAGACLGGLMAVLLWRNISGKSRILLPCAVALGIISVATDVVGGGVVWEEYCKLAAELLVACILLLQVSKGKEDITGTPSSRAKHE